MLFWERDKCSIIDVGCGEGNLQWYYAILLAGNKGQAKRRHRGGGAFFAPLSVNSSGVFVCNL